MREIYHASEGAGCLPWLGSILAFGVGLAFTRAQRDYIKDRDVSCVAPFDHDCNQTTKPLEVHHILGQRYLAFVGKLMGFKIDPDRPENAITLCRNAHHVIHPDMAEAMHHYHDEGADAIKQVFVDREEKLKNREIPWCDQHDRKMQVIAMVNTQKAKLSGKIFPWRKDQLP